MNAQWERVQQLFYEAEALPAERRAPYLEACCGTDEDLRREVQGLLGAHEGADDFFSATLSTAATSALDLPHQRIGAYQVEQPLGHGGMGSVYLAVRADDQFQKYVAIKLLWVNGGAPDLLRRFLAERQILANLNHPGIAALLDGGVTEAGWPYLVMEYCAGQPLDEYCRGRNLTFVERLRLFQQICEAVAHAHRHLVVHCDLKPGNILVSAEGYAKLLDFGTAKLFQPFEAGTPVTRLAERYLTPEYASPEQILGQAVTTSADVYSLGVILHELLTGERLHVLSGKSATECERLICEAEPRRPSATCPALLGDLDSIVLKALAKEPARRYESVSRLSQDIERHLTGRPVEARPNSWVYFTRKFVLRNRVAVAVGLLLAASLATGLVATALAERRAVAAQEKSQAELERMLAAANTSLFGIHDSLVNLPGSTKARAMVVRNVLGYLEPFKTQESGNPALQRKLAEAYERLSEIQFRDGPGYLGESAGALASAAAALHLRESLHDDAEITADILRIAMLERMLSKLPQSINDYERVIARYQAAIAAHPEDQKLLSLLANAYQDMSQPERMSGARESALSHLTQASQIQEQLLKKAPQDPLLLRVVEQTALQRCRLERHDNDRSKAITSCGQALRIAEQLQQTAPSRQHDTDVASTASDLGNVYLDYDNAEALKNYQRSLAIVERLSAADLDDVRMLRSVAIHSTNMALALGRLDKREEAEARFRKALAIHAALSRRDEKNSLPRDDLAYTESALAALLVREGRLEEGVAGLLRSIAMREQILAADGTNVDWRYRLARTWITLGDAREKQGDKPAAIAAYRNSRDQLTELRGKIDMAADLKKVTERLARLEAAPVEAGAGQGMPQSPVR